MIEHLHRPLYEKTWTTMRPLRCPGHCLFIVIIGALATAGCSRRDTPEASNANESAQQARRDTATSPPDAAKVVEFAKRYDFDADSAPVQAIVPIMHHQNQGAKPIDKPTMTIAKAMQRPDQSYPGDEEILARITSDRQYHGLGIDKDTNFVWRYKRDPGDAHTWEVWVIGAKHLTSLQLVRDTLTYSHGDPKQPRLVFGPARRGDTLFGVCFDDPVCGGHCGYSQ
jgi:hypothetical protein